MVNGKRQVSGKPFFVICSDLVLHGPIARSPFGVCGIPLTTYHLPFTTPRDAPRSLAAARGLTLIELLVSISIMAILGVALIQMLSIGEYIWQTSESRRGTYERAQFIFDRLSRDLATLYPRNPEITPDFVFTVDTLFSPWDGSGTPGVTYTSSNISLGEEGNTRWLQATDPTREAWLQYQFSVPAGTKTALIQPRITLARSADCSSSCELAIYPLEAAEGSPLRDELPIYTSGLRFQTFTPVIDLSACTETGTNALTVRFEIVPEAGKSSDIRLFQAAQSDRSGPVLRYFASAKSCECNMTLRSTYDQECPQNLRFVRSDRGFWDVNYWLDNDSKKLFRHEEEGAQDMRFEETDLPSLAAGVVYFGCEFPRQDGSMTPYWDEANSVPPYVRVTLGLVPLSGPAAKATLSKPISATDTTITVNSTRPFPSGSAARQFVKIGNEWIQYASLDGNKLTGCQRCQRGTLPAPHEAGAEAISADTFTMDIPIPASGYRSR